MYVLGSGKKQSNLWRLLESFYQMSRIGGLDYLIIRPKKRLNAYPFQDANLPCAYGPLSP